MASCTSTALISTKTASTEAKSASTGGDNKDNKDDKTASTPALSIVMNGDEPILRDDQAEAILATILTLSKPLLAMITMYAGYSSGDIENLLKDKKLNRIDEIPEMKDPMTFWIPFGVLITAYFVPHSQIDDSFERKIWETCESKFGDSFERKIWETYESKFGDSYESKKDVLKIYAVMKMRLRKINAWVNSKKGMLDDHATGRKKMTDYEKADVNERIYIHQQFVARNLADLTLFPRMALTNQDFQNLLGCDLQHLAATLPSSVKLKLKEFLIEHVDAVYILSECSPLLIAWRNQLPSNSTENKSTSSQIDDQSTKDHLTLLYLLGSRFKEQLDARISSIEKDSVSDSLYNILQQALKGSYEDPVAQLENTFRIPSRFV